MRFQLLQGWRPQHKLSLIGGLASVGRSERFVPPKKNSNVWAGAEGLFQTALLFFGGELELILEVPI